MYILVKYNKNTKILNYRFIEFIKYFYFCDLLILIAFLFSYLNSFFKSAINAKWWSFGCEC